MRDARTAPPWREVRRGLLLIVATTAAALAIFFVDEIRRKILEGPTLVVAAPAAPGLEAGSAVWIAGRDVGRVSSVTFREPGTDRAGNVVIEAILRRTAPVHLRSDATARLQPADLLEPVVLSLHPGSGSAPPFDLSDTLRTETAQMPQETALALMDSLRLALDAGRPARDRFKEQMSSGSGTLPRLRRDEALISELRGHLASIRELRDRRGASLDRLYADTALRVMIDSVRTRFARIESRQDSLRSVGAVRPLEVAAGFDSLRARIDRMTLRLEAGHGTAGRALHDEAILREVRHVRARLDSVIVELTENPLRWLRFKLF